MIGHGVAEEAVLQDMGSDIERWYGDASDAMCIKIDSSWDYMLRNGLYDDVLKPFEDMYGNEWMKRFVCVEEFADALFKLYIGETRTENMVRMGRVLMALADTEWNEMYIQEECEIDCGGDGDYVGLSTMGMMLMGEGIFGGF